MKSTYKRLMNAMLVLGLPFATLGAFLTSPIASAQGTMECGDVKTSIIDCRQLGGGQDGSDNDGSHIFGLILMAINILSAGIGIVAVGGIAYGALLYAAAGDKQDQVQKGIGIIKNVVIGLIAYFALFAFVQFLIPGGVFN